MGSKVKTFNSLKSASGLLVNRERGNQRVFWTIKKKLFYSNHSNLDVGKSPIVERLLVPLRDLVAPQVLCLSPSQSQKQDFCLKIKDLKLFVLLENFSKRVSKISIYFLYIILSIHETSFTVFVLVKHSRRNISLFTIMAECQVA